MGITNSWPIGIEQQIAGKILQKEMRRIFMKKAMVFAVILTFISSFTVHAKVYTQEERNNIGFAYQNIVKVFDRYFFLEDPSVTQETLARTLEEIEPLMPESIEDLDPDLIYVYESAMAMSMFFQGKFEEGEVFANKAYEELLPFDLKMRVDSTNQQQCYGLAKLYIVAGNYEMAELCINAIDEGKYPSDRYANEYIKSVYLATIYLKSGQTEEADKWVYQVINNKRYKTDQYHVPNYQRIAAKFLHNRPPH
ncbi:hypothetical protein LJB89_04335 [Tyzzerella sp. OttesenSCG-928-J15]|nr:hypothetical protein [Tyzzerella sp. OttesenSCG-928-J15]